MLRPGEVKLFLSGFVSDGDRYFDRDGRLRSRGDWRKSDLQLSAEVGVNDRFVAFGQTALEKIVAKDGARAERSGLGRSEFGLRAKVLEFGGWIASLQGSAVIAGAKKSDGLAAVGETDDQFDLRGLIARSFEIFGKNAFVDIEAGYRFRGDDPANEIRLDATVGLRLTDRWQLLLQSFNTVGTSAWDGPYALTQRIHKVQGAVLFDVDERWQLYVAGFATPVGRDALDERGALLGLGLHF